MFMKILVAVALVGLPASATFARDASSDKSKVTLVYEHALPNVPGKSIKGVLVEYQPGGSSPAHTHPPPPSSTQRSAGRDPQQGQ